MQNYTYTTSSVHFIWCCIQVRGGERGLERVKWGRRAVPLRGDQPPTYNPWWARWGLGLCRWAGGGGGTIPFKFNLCWCAACCDCHFARWRKMENSRTKIQKARQLTWKLDWERSKLFSELDLYQVHFFLHRRASWQGNMHRGFLSEFLSSAFFLPALSEWWPTQSTSSLNFSKDQFSPFENSDLLLHSEYRACLISCKLTLDLTIARLWRKPHFFRADEVAFPWGRCWWPEMQVCQIEIGGLQTLWKRFYGSNLFQFQRNPFPVFKKSVSGL